jgi:hypothetical protein
VVVIFIIGMVFLYMKGIYFFIPQKRKEKKKFSLISIKINLAKIKIFFIQQNIPNTPGSRVKDIFNNKKKLKGTLRGLFLK